MMLLVGVFFVCIAFAIFHFRFRSGLYSQRKTPVGRCRRPGKILVRPSTNSSC
jgi:hypothetical protein